MSEQAEETRPNSSNTKLLLYIVAVIPIVTIASFILVTKVINPRLGAPPAAEQAAAAESSMEEDANAPTFMCELGTLLVNPAGKNSRRIMKVSIFLEVSSEAVSKKVEEIKPKLEHKAILILSSQDLSVVSSPQGKKKVQEEIKTSLAKDLDSKDGRLIEVYFSEFVIQ